MVSVGQVAHSTRRRFDFRMAPPCLPAPLQKWAESQQLSTYEWRKPGVADYMADSDTWQVGEVTLGVVTETNEERYYCGLYEGPLEPQPVMYYMSMPLAMLTSQTSKGRSAS
jgi:hypothetical protein